MEYESNGSDRDNLRDDDPMSWKMIAFVKEVNPSEY